MPKNPWPGSYRLHQPTTILDRDTFLQIYRACVSEVRKTMEMFYEGKEMIVKAADMKDLLNLQSSVYLRSPYLILAAAERLYPVILPNREKFKKEHATLASVIEKAGGFLRLHNYLYPSPRGLTPFILLFGIHFAYNPDTLLEVEISDFSYENILGQSRIKAAPNKRRSRRTQRRSFPVTEDIDNPATLIEFIKIWTQRIRVVAPNQVKDRLFLYRLENSPKGATTFGASTVSKGISSSGDGAWADGLARFCNDNQLNRFTLKQIRHTVLDLAHELFSGDLRAVRAVGGQRSPDVILSHYTSDAAKQRNDENLANAMALRDRDLISNGKIDPRRSSAEGDVSAATPGWGCLDPYDSPMPMQKKDRLCTSYGLCPVCELAILDLNSPIACSRAIELDSLIEHSKVQVSPLSWLSRWAPVQTRLQQFWIPQFSDQALKGADEMALTPMPPLE